MGNLVENRSRACNSRTSLQQEAICSEFGGLKGGVGSRHAAGLVSKAPNFSRLTGFLGNWVAMNAFNVQRTRLTATLAHGNDELPVQRQLRCNFLLVRADCSIRLYSRNIDPADVRLWNLYSVLLSDVSFCSSS